MKVWELEEGVEYIEREFNRRYTVRNSELMYLSKDEITWYESDKHYGELVRMDFTEYTPPTYWSKVEVDTKVLVSNDNINWYNRHFAKYENGRIYAWVGGYTSFTWKSETDYEDKEDAMMSWNYAKLYKEE